MKSMRIPLLIALGVAIIGIVFGSFFDLSISKAIASSSNGFALFISAICPTIGFAAVACMGGGFIRMALKGEYHIVLKIGFYILAACCLGVSIYFPAGEYFGVNGFYGAAPEWVGYLIVIVPECAAMAGGYFLFKDYQNKNLWMIFAIIIVLLLIALVALIPVLKDSIHRPRFRFLNDVAKDFDLYHNWWEPTKNYKDLIELYKTSKDNFKSYPSGHTAETAILIVAATFLPLANKKFEKYQLWLFLGACGFVLLVAIARILAAAHFLSDVSFGATIVIALTVIANEVVMRVKALQIKEEKAE